MDAAPESWGRRLLERAYGGGPSAFDYRILSDDHSRQGALRFLDSDGKIIRAASPDSVSRLVDLGRVGMTDANCEIDAFMTLPRSRPR